MINMEGQGIRTGGASTIGKMMIRGIRSFDPGHEETIEFYSPLTMIVGANGCGKTTIIESLKYATTGLLPPGARAGHSFVNDPGITDTTEVKAQIKLRFNNYAGEVNVIARSLQLLKKAKTMQFKALDGTLKTKRADGKSFSVSMKCAELDSHIPQLLSVSPAILENVIFVHQEDSSWPMSEGAVLKKKFDDIFESTRYTKALEAFKKSKKEFADKAKDLKAELMEQKAHLEAANNSKLELEECEEQAEVEHEHLSTLKAKLEANSEQADHVRDELDKLQVKYSEITELNREKEEIDRRNKDRLSMLETRYREPDAVLQEKLDNFESLMTSKVKELNETRGKIDSIEAEIQQLRTTSDRLMLAQGTAESLSTQFAHNSRKYAEQVGDIRRRFDIGDKNYQHQSGSIQSGFGTAALEDWEACEATYFWDALNCKIAEMQRESDSLISQKKGFFDACTATVADLQYNTDRHEMDLDMKVGNKSELENIVDSLKDQIRNLATAKTKLSDREADYEQARKELMRFVEPCVGGTKPVSSSSIAGVGPPGTQPGTNRPGYDRDGNYLGYDRMKKDITANLNQAHNQLQKLNSQISEDASILTSLSSQRSEMMEKETAFKQAEKDLKEEVAELNKFWTKNRGVLNIGDRGVPESIEGLTRFCDEEGVRHARMNSNHTRDLAALRKASSEVSAADALIQDLNARKQALEANKGGDTMRIFEGLRLRYIKLRDDMFAENVLKEAKLDEDIIVAKFRGIIDDKIQILSKVVHKIQGSVSIKKIFDNIKNGQDECPCCKRDLDTEALKMRFESSYKEIFQLDISEKKDTYRNLGTGFEKIKEDFLEIEEYLRTDSRQSIEIVGLERNIIDKGIALETSRAGETHLKAEVEKIGKESKDLGVCLQKLREFKISWTNKQETEKDRRNEKERVMNFYGKAYSGRSIEDIEADQEHRRQSQIEAQDKKDKMVQIEKDMERRYFALEKNMTEKNNALLTLQKECSLLSEYEQSLASKEDELMVLSDNIRTLKQSRSDLSRELDIKKAELTEKSLDLEHCETQCKARLDDIRSVRDGFKGLDESLREMNTRLAGQDTKQIADELETVQTNIALKDSQVKELTPKMASMNAEIASEERVKLCILENLDIRKGQHRIKTIEHEVTNLQKKLGLPFDGENGGDDPEKDGVFVLDGLQRDLQRYNQKRDKMLQELHKCEGRLEVLNKQAIDIKSKLNSRTYKDVEERHLRKTIEFETTELAVKDLDSYYTGLDQAIQTFHTRKIKEINKIIRELWQLIYKGQDIDLIELESGVDAETTNRATRSYNYRVVMRKGDTPLDMRGRCSAGQRVLAAIVIRLALAETFCLNCGILALDEPTTNLDEANRSGLANALAKIIIARQKQQNFQLICITHDEEFVKLMNTELAANSDFSMPEYYFKVSREEDEEGTGKYFSKIERLYWTDM